MKYIFDLHKTMLDNHLILVYEGEFTQEITKSVLAMAERNMDSSGEESSVKRKVFNVMVECLQNIAKHADAVANKHSAVFMVGKQENEYIVISGNSIMNENIAELKAKLDKINGLDKDGLKELYKDIIKNTAISDKGGAGLGFVDMARKSGKKLDYNFVELGDDSSFFCLKSSIERL
jgi:coenzyme F420-reducing hydrogenase delta subunit